METRQITDNWVLQTLTSWRGTGSRGSGRETELQQLNAGSLTMERRPSYRVYLYIRQRKIERIAQLDSEVAQLKLENQGLEQVGGPQRTRGGLRMRR